ncbi:efflux RND transporter periplasmic adaptor subunit [Spirillospora sp. NPDC048911]|uniref:efflux RND transporter periplasmic adaptor subunit n=1 Tax=Spirillospora sp. NPDC048911 TaxID=3364527 RepID=UPI003710465E
MRRRRFPCNFYLVALGVLLSAAVAGACTGRGDGKKVQLGSVGRSDVVEVVEAPASVLPRASATQRASAEGTIRRVFVDDGDRVRKGEVLVKIDSPMALEQLDQAREADRIASSGASAGVRAVGFRGHDGGSVRRGFDAARQVTRRIADPGRRARVLAEISRAEGDYRAAEAGARTAVAQVTVGLAGITRAMSSMGAAQRVQTGAAVRAAERTVSDLTLRAPFSGVVTLGGLAAGGAGGLGELADRLPQQLRGQVTTDQGAPSLAGAGGSGQLGGAPRVGALVTAGSSVGRGDAMVTVVDVSELALSADVDETDVLKVRPGVPADVELDAVPGGRYAAEVTGVRVTPNTSGGGGVNYRVTLKLRHGTTVDGVAAPWPKPGMSAVVKLRVRQVLGAVSVPSAAVVTSGQVPTVWVVSGGRAQRRVVKLGARGEAAVQVLSGVREGERIVLGGADSVRQGEEISG